MTRAVHNLGGYMAFDELSTEVSANLAQARQNAEMAHRILIKFKEMDLPESLDEELSKLCTDLGDMWSTQLMFIEKLGKLIEFDTDWNLIGDYLTDIKAHIDHISWHAQSVEDPIMKIAEFAYARDI